MRGISLPSSLCTLGFLRVSVCVSSEDLRSGGAFFAALFVSLVYAVILKFREGRPVWAPLARCVAAPDIPHLFLFLQTSRLPQFGLICCDIIHAYKHFPLGVWPPLHVFAGQKIEKLETVRCEFHMTHCVA